MHKSPIQDFNTIHTEYWNKRHESHNKFKNSVNFLKIQQDYLSNEDLEKIDEYLKRFQTYNIIPFIEGKIKEKNIDEKNHLSQYIQGLKISLQKDVVEPNLKLADHYRQEFQKILCIFDRIDSDKITTKILVIKYDVITQLLVDDTSAFQKKIMNLFNAPLSWVDFQQYKRGRALHQELDKDYFPKQKVNQKENEGIETHIEGWRY